MATSGNKAKTKAKPVNVHNIAHDLRFEEPGSWSNRPTRVIRGKNGQQACSTCGERFDRGTVTA